MEFFRIVFVQIMLMIEVVERAVACHRTHIQSQNSAP